MNSAPNGLPPVSGRAARRIVKSIGASRARLREVALRGGVVAVPAGVRGDPEVQTRADLVVGEVADGLARVVGGDRHVAGAHPAAHGVEVRPGLHAR